MTRRKTYQRGSVSLHNGKWTLRYHELDHATHTWKQRREVLGKFKDKKAALSAAAPIMARVNERNNSEPRKLKADMTFKEFIETEWERYSSNEEHEPSTVDTYMSALEKHFKPVFGERKLREIQPTEIGDFLKRKRREGFAGNTLLQFYRLLRLIFDIALQLDLIDKSPVRPKLHKPEVETDEKPTFTPAQIREVLKQTEDDQERLFILLLAVTGLRMGEAAALRWTDFVAPNCQLSINHTLYRVKLKAPKTKTSKTALQIHPTIAALLESHRQQSQFKGPADFVFCRPCGKPLNLSVVRVHLYEAMEKAGIERIKGQHGFHTFRHSAGTLLYEKSRDLKLVQGALRHGDISTTSDIYVHLSGKVVGEGTEVLTDEILANCDLFVTQRSEMVS